MYYVRFLFAIILIFCSGDGLLRLIGRRGSRRYLGERVFLSYGLGIGLIALLQLYAVFLRIPLNRKNILLLISPFLIMEIFFLFRGVKGGINKLLSGNNYLRTRRRIILEGSLVGYLVILSLLMLWVCLVFPMYTWDARAIWGFKAKVLFHQQTVFTPDFLDAYRFHPNTRYPLLIPFAENFFYNLLGRVDDYLVKAVFALFFITLILFLYHTQRRHFLTTRLHALIFTAIGASLPFLFVIYNGSVPSAYADFPLGCLYAISAVYLFKFMQNKNFTDLVLSGLFGAFVIFTKNEGLILFLLCCAIFFIELTLDKKLLEKRSLFTFLFYLALPIILLLPWFFIRNKLPTVYDINPFSRFTISNIADNLFRTRQVMRLTFREMFLNFTSWGIIWPIIAIIILLRHKECRWLRFHRYAKYLLFIPFVYYFLVITPVYIFSSPFETPTEIEFNGTSFERLRMHAFMLLIFFISLKFEALTSARKQ